MQPDLTIIGAMLAIMLALTEAIKLLIKKTTEKRNGNNGSDTHAVYALIRRMSEESTELYKWHSKTDENGTPIWYMKKSIEKSIVDLKEDVNNIQKDIQELLLRSRLRAKPGSAEYRKIMSK